MVIRVIKLHGFRRIKAVLINVAHYSDDGVPGLIRRPGVDSSAQRILAWPQQACRGFVDERDIRMIAIVLIREEPAVK